MTPEISRARLQSGRAVIVEDAEDETKISLSIGKDTLARLDRIVNRAGFGGRGRALDSLLESLDEIMTYVRRFNKSISQVSEGSEGTSQDAKVLRDAVMAAALAFTKMERFYGLEPTQVASKE